MNEPRVDVTPLDTTEPGVPTSLFGEDIGLTEDQEAELQADSPELFNLLKEIEDDAKAVMNGTAEENPLSDQPVNKLIQTYLSCTPHGIRWLAEKANVKRKRIQRFFDGDDDAVTIDEVSRLIDTILTHRQKETASTVQNSAIAMDLLNPRNSHLKKTVVGGNRADRRARAKQK